MGEQLDFNKHRFKLLYPLVLFDGNVVCYRSNLFCKIALIVFLGDAVDVCNALIGKGKGESMLKFRNPFILIILN